MAFSKIVNVTCTFELCTLCMYALPKLVTVLKNGSHYKAS